MRYESLEGPVVGLCLRFFQNFTRPKRKKSGAGVTAGLPARQACVQGGSTDGRIEVEKDYEVGVQIERKAVVEWIDNGKHFRSNHGFRRPIFEDARGCLLQVSLLQIADCAREGVPLVEEFL